MQVAFTGMEPFPARSVLTSRHGRHHSEIQSQWQVRERELKGREAQSRQQKLKKPVRDGCGLVLVRDCPHTACSLLAGTGEII